MADKRNYAVGKGKPPKHSQFKKGNCANPKGRGATKNFKTDLREELSETIPLYENGERKVISKQRGMIKAAMAKALQGDMRAMAVLTTLTVKLLEAELAEESKNLSHEDVAIFEEYIRRRLEAEKKKGGKP